MPAAIIFTILFLLITAIHLYQVIRTKTMIFIPFVIGGLCKFIPAMDVTVI
jgi:hypothetical protein